MQHFMSVQFSSVQFSSVSPVQLFVTPWTAACQACLSITNSQSLPKPVWPQRCYQFSSVTQSCLTFCNPMDCHMPGFPVHYQLPEPTPTHVHRVSDASNHLILCPLLLPPSIFPSIRVFSNESVLCIRLPKYWHFSFNISPFNEYLGLISIRMDWLDLLQSKGLSRVFSNTTVQKHQFFRARLSLESNSLIHTWLMEKQ